LRELRAFDSGPDDLKILRFLPDGKRFLLYSDTMNHARIRDAATGAELFMLEHTEPIQAIAFLARRTARSATASGDKTARTWSTSDGRPLQHFEGHAAAVLAVVFSHDGAGRLVTAFGGRHRPESGTRTDDKADPIVLSMPNENRHGLRRSLPTRGGLSPFRRPATFGSPRIWNAADGTLIMLLDDKSRIAWTDGRHIVIGEQRRCQGKVSGRSKSLDAVGNDCLGGARVLPSRPRRWRAGSPSRARALSVYGMPQDRLNPAQLESTEIMKSLVMSPERLDGFAAFEAKRRCDSGISPGGRHPPRFPSRLYRTTMNVAYSVAFSPDGERAIHAPSKRDKDLERER
jgi:hypothetical protein